ncbi:MAG: LytTR family transcriptional regulator [Treponema sp.]|nr:LytTR family transcriptional regulator [Treponema sp.]
MIINLKQNTTKKDIEVTIEYPVMNKTVNRIVSLVKSADTQVECYIDDSLKLINVSEVYYIESIDKKTIVFDEKQGYYNKNRLYQLYEKLANKGFVQISKYCIVNINKLEKIKTLANSHLKAELSNGKCLYVTRKYLENIRLLLKEDR